MLRCRHCITNWDWGVSLRGWGNWGAKISLMLQRKVGKITNPFWKERVKRYNSHLWLSGISWRTLSFSWSNSNNTGLLCPKKKGITVLIYSTWTVQRRCSKKWANTCQVRSLRPQVVNKCLGISHLWPAQPSKSVLATIRGHWRYFLLFLWTTYPSIPELWVLLWVCSWYAVKLTSCRSNINKVLGCQN